MSIVCSRKLKEQMSNNMKNRMDRCNSVDELNCVRCCYEERNRSFTCGDKYCTVHQEGKLDRAYYSASRLRIKMLRRNTTTFDAEFRRFSIDRSDYPRFDSLKQILQTLHHLQDTQFVVQYTDPKDNDLLPINNDDNFLHAINVCRHILRILLQRKGESYGEINGYGSARPKKSALSRLTGSGTIPAKLGPQIMLQDDFRRVSSIIDVDIVPETLRRVKLMKSGTRPLGFYIRDGTSIRVSPSGIEKVPSIFISRLLSGGLAESTGLLAVNDEVIEVNGIEVSGKSLDQVTDMMVANSSNLIITVKPVNQSTCLPPRRSVMAGIPSVDNLRSSGGMFQGKRSSQVSNHSLRSQDSNGSREEGDEVREFTSMGSGKGRASGSRDLVRATPEEEDDGIVTL